MAVNGPRDFMRYEFANSTLTTNHQTVIGTLRGVAAGADSLAVDLSGWVDLIIDEDMTSVIVWIARDAIDGVVVGQATYEPAVVVGATEFALSVEGLDIVSPMSDGVYVLCVQVVGGTGDSTAVTWKLRATVTPDGGGIVMS